MNLLQNLIVLFPHHHHSSSHKPKMCHGTVEHNEHLGNGQHLHFDEVKGCHVIIDPVLTGDATEVIDRIDASDEKTTPTISDHGHLDIGSIHAGGKVYKYSSILI